MRKNYDSLTSEYTAKQVDWLNLWTEKVFGYKSEIVQWNPTLRTPRYNGQFRLSRRKSHIFSLKLTRSIRTPVNTDNGHFSVSRVTNAQTSSTRLYTTDTGYLRTVSFHCHNYVLIVDIVPCSNNDSFYGLKAHVHPRGIARRAEFRTVENSENYQRAPNSESNPHSSNTFPGISLFFFLCH